MNVMMSPGTMKERPQAVETKAPAISDPKMFPTDVCEFHTPMINPRLLTRTQDKKKTLSVFVELTAGSCLDIDKWSDDFSIHVFFFCCCLKNNTITVMCHSRNVYIANSLFVTVCLSAANHADNVESAA